MELMPMPFEIFQGDTAHGRKEGVEAADFMGEQFGQAFFAVTQPLPIFGW